MTAAIATPHHLSAQAGRQTLEQGGNAVDAAVAAIAAQGVVAPETCGIGGDLFALVQSPGWDTPRALNASGRAGSGVSANEMRRVGMSEIPSDHPAAVSIPGCVDGFETLVSQLGRLELDEVLEPAIALAAEGFEVSNEQAGAFGRKAGTYASNPAVSSFYPGGVAVRAGDVVARTDLADTLRAVATGGRAGFYEGDAGEDIVTALGGAITTSDLMAHQAEWVEPIGTEVAGMTAWTAPPNSQGYLGPGTLAVFEMLDPPDEPGDPMWWHLLIEAYRCLAWERNDLVADPDNLAIPAADLLDRERLARAAESVDRDRAGVWPRRIGRPSGTAYLCVADDDGMAVSMIQSNYRGTGSPFGAARSGFLLHDRGTGFNLTPGHPNELAPGKRPLHTLSPTLWSERSQPRWIMGSRGGAVQPQLIAQVAARAILAGAGLSASQETPRWTVAEFGPGSSPQLSLEPGCDELVMKGLLERGHEVTAMDRRQSGWGPVSMIEVRGPDRRAAADPRVDTATALIV